MGEFERTVLRFIEENGLVKRGTVCWSLVRGDRFRCGSSFYGEPPKKVGDRSRRCPCGSYVERGGVCRGRCAGEQLMQAVRHSVLRQKCACPRHSCRKGGNVQAVCRIGRYALFEEIMQKDDFACLVTAHHADDQLETMLMQMTKGSRRLACQRNGNWASAG